MGFPPSEERSGPEGAEVADEDGGKGASPGEAQHDPDAAEEDEEEEQSQGRRTETEEDDEDDRTAREEDDEEDEECK